MDLVQSGLAAWWGPALAFAAGVVSFASPCVLPLVPGYLSFVTGDRALAHGGGGGAVRTQARPAILPILLFVLGFTLTFVVLFGFTATALGRALNSAVGERVAGVLVLIFGALLLLYAFRARIPGLYRESRPLLSRARPGPVGALPLGAAFAIGWTPCVGPVLGGILTLAANQGGTARTVLMLVAYSLGLGLPFVLVGLGLGRVVGALRFLSRHYRWIAGVSGAAMIAIGVLLVAGAWTRLVAPWVSRFAPNLPI